MTSALALHVAADATDFGVPCDCTPCGGGASWALVTECCGDTVLVCDRHHAWAGQPLSPSSVWECAGCERTFPQGDSFLQHCVRVERIK